MTEKPATASLTPNDTAAPLLEVAEEDDPVAVPLVVDPPREVASAVVLHVNVP